MPPPFLDFPPLTVLAVKVEGERWGWWVLRMRERLLWFVGNYCERILIRLIFRIPSLQWTSSTLEVWFLRWRRSAEGRFHLGNRKLPRRVDLLNNRCGWCYNHEIYLAFVVKKKHEKYLFYFWMSRISDFSSAGKVIPVNLFSNFSDLFNNFSNVEGGESKF